MSRLYIIIVPSFDLESNSQTTLFFKSSAAPVFTICNTTSISPSEAATISEVYPSYDVIRDLSYVVIDTDDFTKVHQTLDCVQVSPHSAG